MKTPPSDKEAGVFVLQTDAFLFFQMSAIFKWIHLLRLKNADAILRVSLLDRWIIQSPDISITYKRKK